MPNVSMIMPKLNRLNINKVVQPFTLIVPANLQINTTTAQIIAPIQEKAPIPETMAIGKVEKLNKVSATSRIFFFNVHLLVPTSLASRV